MSTGHAGIDIGPFNALSDAEARGLLSSCLAVPRWVDEVMAGRPYVDRHQVLRQARESAGVLTEAEIGSALARHPRIGERAGADHDRDFSQHEQSGVGAEDESVAAALRLGNVQYETRFHRIFLIRAAGRSAPEILAELERRLKNSAQVETAEVATQLCEIAMLRLEQLIPGSASEPQP